MKIDFAWFLAVWMLNYHQPEQMFWQRMNPARMVILMKALVGKNKAEQRERDRIESLSTFLKGGC